MGVATYEGIKIKDKLPSVEDLKKRLDMVEQELTEYKENEEATHPIKKQNSCIILYFYALDNSYLYQYDINS